MLNSDCTYTMTAGENLHYEAEPGRWEEVDLRFREEGEGHVADRNSTIVRVSGANLEVSDRETGRGIRWVLPGPPAVNGHRARFQASGLEWTYSVTTGGVKLEATVDAPRGPRTYTFPYQVLGSGNPRERDLEVDQGGNLQGDGFEIPRAFAIGADGRTYVAGKWQLLEGQRVAYDFDDTDLPPAAYPYVLDPSTHFIVNSPDNDGHVNKWGYSYPPTNCNGWAPNFSTMYAMRTRNGDGQFNTINGFVSWDTSPLPDDATVTWAGVEIFAQDKGNSDARNLTADWYSAWPIDCTDASDFALTSAIAGYPISNISTTTDTDIGLEGYQTGVSKTGRTGLRMHVSGGQPTGSNFVQIWQYGSGVQPPQLNLLYSLPSAPPTITSASDAPDPVTAGAPVTFTVGWSDPDAGDSVRALICKTNSVTVEGNCAGGTWASGAHKTTSPSTAQLTTSGMIGTYTYYAFACDISGACSSALTGSFTVLAPNSAPTISSATDSPDPVTAGNPVNFQVGWSDPNAGDTVRAVICKTNAVSSGTCPGGAWATGSLSSSSPATASYTTSSADVGTRSYYAFACDQSNACSGSIAGSFTVVAANSPPSATLTVLPTSGNRETTFQAQLSGSDPNGDPISYRIDWGDGAVSNSSSASHVYRNAGTYTVTGTVTDSKGASSSDSETVTVEFSNRPPNANLTVSPKAGDTQTTFSASVSGSDPDGDSVSYRIDWGDGTTTNGRDGTHTYRSPGRYDVVGTVTDQYGLEGSDEETITVCAVYQGGQCVETPERPKPPPLPLPGPVSSTLARVLQQRPDVTKAVRSATNSIMVLNANLIQAYARGHREYTATCTRTSHKTCGAGMRLDRFVDRIEALVRKPATTTGDGMGGVVPDVIVLQEVLTPHADAIAKKLSSRFDMRNRVDFMFEVAMSFDRAEIANEQAERKYCADQKPGATPEQIEECEDQIITKGDVAIIYNHDTVEPIPGTQRVVETRYSPDERCTPPATAPPGGWDFDNDNQADCRFAKWKHQVALGFAETRRNGTTTGYTMAVASTHLVTASHFDGRLTAEEVEEGVEEEPEANPNHERRKLQWTDQVAREIATIAADSYVIAGDLNIHRCATKNHKERGDYPQGAACGPRAWYTNLTSEPTASPLPPPGPPPGPTAEPAPEPRGYADTIWSLHEDEDDRLVPQYRDGLLGSGAGQRYRHKRIDYIFSRSAELLGSSFDLTCGQNPPRGIPPNCFDDYRNPDYYSDHRIIWTLMSDG